MARQKADNGNNNEDTHGVNQLGELLKKHKSDILNYEPTHDFKVSTGSLSFDYRIGGGIGPGIVRMAGDTESGKTSQSLNILKNFLATVPDSKGFYVKAEGRLGEEVKARSGIKFVFNHEDWVPGTCFVLEGNIFETTFDIIRDLIRTNPHNFRYCFIIDSFDALVGREDSMKSSDEAVKVAGGALLTSVFLKNVGLGMSRKGHLALVISQVRAKLDMSRYQEKGTPQKANYAGPHSLKHACDWIFEFVPKQFGSDYILSDPSSKVRDDEKNPAVGHYCKVIIRKSTNETTGSVVEYPIKYKQKNGNSVWLEREIVDILLMFNLILKEGNTGYILGETIKSQCANGGFEIPEKISGYPKLQTFFEENPKMCLFLKDMIKSTLLQNEAPSIKQ